MPQAGQLTADLVRHAGADRNFQQCLAVPRPQRSVERLRPQGTLTARRRPECHHPHPPAVARRVRQVSGDAAGLVDPPFHKRQVGLGDRLLQELPPERRVGRIGPCRQDQAGRAGVDPVQQRWHERIPTYRHQFRMAREHCIHERAGLPRRQRMAVPASRLVERQQHGILVHHRKGAGLRAGNEIRSLGKSLHPQLIARPGAAPLRHHPSPDRDKAIRKGGQDARARDLRKPGLHHTVQPLARLRRSHSDQQFVPHDRTPSCAGPRYRACRS